MRNLYYFITVSPPYRGLSVNKLFRQDTDQMRQLFNQFSDHYCLYPEFDDKGRLHYHGIVRITDKIKYFKVKYRIDQIGYCCAKELKTHMDHMRSLLYCMKEWPDTRRLFTTPFIYSKPSKAPPKKQLKVNPKCGHKHYEPRPFTIVDAFEYGVKRNDNG